jgi:AGCS family alanine or glycine:cation symporter
MLLITGKYNVQNPNFGTDGASEFLYNGAQNVSVGPGFTQSAMDSVFPGFGSYFVAIALFFFAFTTILAYYYIAETNISLTRNLNSPIYNHILKVVMMLVIMYGSINQAKLAWDIGDLGVGLMAWFNIAIILLQNQLYWP